MIIEILFSIVIFLIAYSIYAQKKVHQYFEKNDVKYSPGVPLFGNLLKSKLLRRHAIYDLDEVYKAFPEEKYVGFIMGTSPVILIRDPQLIKAITVKDFDHFVDHDTIFPKETEPMLGNSLLMMKGDRWRDMRVALSPVFTSYKLRQMMPFMIENSKNVIEYLQEHQDEDLEIRDVIDRYTADVVFSAVLRIQVVSVQERDNELYKMVQSLINLSFLDSFNLLLAMLLPALSESLRIPMFPRKTTQKFKELVTGIINLKIDKNLKLPDMIQLLMKNKGWSQEEVLGQIFFYVAAGFDSSAGALVLCLHELAINPKVQEKLYQEVREFKERRGTLTSENIEELEYLECVLHETFRKYTLAMYMDRICTKSYVLPPPREGGKPYQVNPGDLILNLVNSLHMDPDHFPDPDKFDPDRFSAENKHKIKPFTYMPFGMGPRICAGARFVLLELKVLLYHLALNFQIQKCAKTTDPIQIEAVYFETDIKAKGGSWIGLKAR